MREIVNERGRETGWERGRVTGREAEREGGGGGGETRLELLGEKHALSYYLARELNRDRGRLSIDTDAVVTSDITC